MKGEQISVFGFDVKKIQILFGEAKQDEKAAKISAWKAGMWLKSHWKNIDVKKLEIT